MTYKLNPEVRKICAPITLRFANGKADMSFLSGEALADACFDRNYLITKYEVKNDAVVLTLNESSAMPVVNWVGEEAVSFF